MKRLFFAALVAVLFCIATFHAQNIGQQNNVAGDSLTNSYWRNERTGDWEIAFFEDCAIYRCKFWTYKRRDVNSKTGEARFVLTDGNEELPVSVGKYKKGKRPLRIGGQKVICSRLTGEHLPPYPVEDTRTDFVNSGYRMDTVTVSGWIRNSQDLLGGNKALQVSVQEFFSGEESSFSVNLDTQGRFTVKIPLLNTAEVFFDGAGYNTAVVLEPGKNYFILYDLDSLRHYFMGDDVRMQNEFFANIHPFDWQPVSLKLGENFDSYIASVDNNLRVYSAKVDSVCNLHSLSGRYKAYFLGGALWSQAFRFGQARFNTEAMCLPDNARRYARDAFWMKITEPVTLHLETRLFLNDYLDEVIQDGSSSFSFNPMDYLSEIASNDHELETLTRWQRFLTEGKARQEAASTEEEKQQIIAENIALNKELTPEATRILNGSKAQNLFRGYAAMAEIARYAHVLDSLQAAPIVKDVYLCSIVYGMIDQSCRHMNPAVIDTLRVYAGNPIGIERVEQRNEYYRALANREFDKLVFKSSDDLQGISEGEELLRKVLEPFKGKFVLLDVWGTWCGPCKQALSHSAEEYTRLNKYNVAYLYLANNSTTEAWENVIKEYNVSGENVAHYNLPAEQQQAIERYLSVSSFPTYKLFDRDGNLLDIEVDARDLNRLENIIRQLSGQ